MMASSHAREVIRPDDITFSHVWLTGGFLLFGIVAFAYNAWLIKRAGEPSFKRWGVLALCATGYLSLALYGSVWALVHAINNR